MDGIEINLDRVAVRSNVSAKNMKKKNVTEAQMIIFSGENHYLLACLISGLGSVLKCARWTVN